MPSKKDNTAGYKRPPKATQFKKGQSGNPKGRPKKKGGFVGDVTKAFATKLPLVINGRRQVLTVSEITAKRIAQRAMAGDTAILRLLGLDKILSHVFAIAAAEESVEGDSRAKDWLRAKLDKIAERMKIPKYSDHLNDDQEGKDEEDEEDT